MNKDWTYKRLGEVVCFPTNRVSSSNIDESNYVGVDNLIKDRGGKGEASIIPSEGNCIEYKKGDVLIGNIRPYLKKIWLADNNGGASGDVLVLRANDSQSLYPDYLYWSLATDSFFEYDMLHSKGAKMPRGSKVDILKYEIPLPPLSQQQQIASELDLLSGVIEKLKAQLEELDKLAQSIFYDMFGDPVTNERRWNEILLGKACVCITDGDHMPPPKSDNGIPFITISDIDKMHRDIVFDETFYVPQDYYDSLKEDRKAKVGDVLYTVTGSYGIPVVIKSDKHFCFQRHIALLRPNQELLNTSFLCYWILCDSVKHMADDVATGIAQKTVGLNSLRKFPIILPPLALQQDFAAKVEQIESMKAKVRQSLTEAETLFNSRMDYYFN